MRASTAGNRARMESALCASNLPPSASPTARPRSEPRKRFRKMDSSKSMSRVMCWNAIVALPSAGRLIVFLVPIDVLGRALADALGHPRVLAARHHVLDLLDVDLVPPVVAEVEPVAEPALLRQAQRVEGRLVH